MAWYDWLTIGFGVLGIPGNIFAVFSVINFIKKPKIKITNMNKYKMHGDYFLRFEIEIFSALNCIYIEKITFRCDKFESNFTKNSMYLTQLPDKIAINKGDKNNLDICCELPEKNCNFNKAKLYIKTTDRFLRYKLRIPNDLQIIEREFGF